jgi:RNA polymerase sigma-70 factor (ECF subfamily)
MQTQERTGVQPRTSVDGVLIQQARAGDEQAFEGLVRRYQGPLFQYIYHFVGDYDLACDIFQQVLLQLYRSLPTLCTIQPLKPWLLRVAHNGCVSELRRRRLIHFSELEVVDEEEDSCPLIELADREPLPEEVAERHDLQQRLQQAIVALPPKFRAIHYRRGDRYPGRIRQCLARTGSPYSSSLAHEALQTLTSALTL